MCLHQTGSLTPWLECVPFDPPCAYRCSSFLMELPERAPMLVHPNPRKNLHAQLSPEEKNQQNMNICPVTDFTFKTTGKITTTNVLTNMFFDHGAKEPAFKQISQGCRSWELGMTNPSTAARASLGVFSLAWSPVTSAPRALPACLPDMPKEAIGFLSGHPPCLPGKFSFPPIGDYPIF